MPEPLINKQLGFTLNPASKYWLIPPISHLWYTGGESKALRVTNGKTK